MVVAVMNDRLSPSEVIHLPGAGQRRGGGPRGGLRLVVGAPEPVGDVHRPVQVVQVEPGGHQLLVLRPFSVVLRQAETKKC